MADAGVTLLRTILNRIKELEGLEYDKDLAALFKMSEKALEAQKSRDTVPWERLVEYSREKQVSLEYLVNGHGPARRAQLGVGEPGAIYRVTTDQDAVYQLAAALRAASPQALPAKKFQDALKLLHRELLETGRMPPSEKIIQIAHLADGGN